MNKLTTAIIALVMSVVSVSAFAEGFPTCPTLEDLKAVRFDSTAQKMDGEHYNAIPADIYEFQGNKWAVILSGLESGSVINANKQMQNIDVVESQEAQQEYLMTIPLLACKYKSTKADNIHVVAIPFFNTIDII